MRAEGLMQRLEESTERGGINRESRTEVLVKRMAEVSMRRDKRVVLFLCCEDRKERLCEKVRVRVHFYFLGDLIRSDFFNANTESNHERQVYQRSQQTLDVYA